MGSGTSRGALWLAAALALPAAPAWADTTLSGIVGDSKPGGGSTSAPFSCVGAPTCTGIVTITHKGGNCSNSITVVGDMTATGVDVSRPGSFSGTFSINKNVSSAQQNMDGSCVYTVDAGFVINYAANWTGSSGTISLSGTDPSGEPVSAAGTFTATNTNSSPVFPMTVSGSVTQATSNITAQIQPRSQDTGTMQSVFVFAHAPASEVKDAIVGGKRVTAPPVAVGEKDAVVCVLAQVGPDGQLHAVTAATMQAYLTGVLGAQAQSVTVLNNVSTQNVSGATMFVGYGTSAASMLANGVYQGAVAVPGPVQCTASLAAAPAPESPSALSGLWWNPSESGWGIHFTQRRNIIFAAWYTYDAAGNPKWYVASNCTMPEAASSGTCTGDLYEVSGPVFFGTAFNPSLVHVATAGSLQVSFQDVNNATMTYTVGAQTRTVTITRQVFRTGTAPAVDYTDLWYNTAESGWGMAISHQSDVMFLAWYVYDATGKPFWYVAPACAVSGSSCSGALYRTTGPPLGPTFNPSQVQAFQVGSAIVSFIDANNAVLSYTVDGVSATKTITRQTF